MQTLLPGAFTFISLNETNVINVLLKYNVPGLLEVVIRMESVFNILTTHNIRMKCHTYLNANE